jgi:hypothetical protein
VPLQIERGERREWIARQSKKANIVHVTRLIGVQEFDD